MPLKYKTTADIKVSKDIKGQVIGQDEAVALLDKAAKQRRHLLLIGPPGCGKSLLGQGLAEILPKEKLIDVLSLNNPQDENVPLVRTLPAGMGRETVMKARIQAMTSMKNYNIIIFIVILIVSLLPYYFWRKGDISDIIFAASMITGIVVIVGFILFLNLNKRMNVSNNPVPKMIIDNFDKKKAPFIDATGAHAGALLGDCLHDPLQSGNLGKPAHERIVPGFIHRANKGDLFIDEIGILSPKSQQELLTAMQDKKYSITGQSERSSGAMVRSEPVPCDFILIAAGNIETIQHMHPGLRSRIRGYGYEIYINEDMDDTPDNRDKVVQFVAQEVVKDGKIPHFTKSAIDKIIEESRRLAGKSGKLTVQFRALGGLVRAAGDVARQENAKFVEPQHIIKAKVFARSLEKQIADKYIKNKKEYEVITTKGSAVGRVNGLAVIGSSSATMSGIVLPIESEVTVGGKKTEFIATGKLGEIAKEAVKNVSAIILKHFGEDIKEKYDIYVQFLQTYEGVEGDSASIAVATAIISALKKIPVRQDIAMTGSLSIRGDVLAVGGVSAKVEAAIDAGVKQVLVPKANVKDIYISRGKLNKVKIIPVTDIKEVLKHALVWKGYEEVLKAF